MVILNQLQHPVTKAYLLVYMHTYFAYSKIEEHTCEKHANYNTTIFHTLYIIYVNKIAQEVINSFK